MLIYYTDFYEYNFFFDEDFNLLHYWPQNDAIYRNECMGPFLDKLGYQTKFIKPQDERVKKIIAKILVEQGYDASDVSVDLYTPY